MNLTLHSIYFFKCYYSLGMEIKGRGLKDHGRAIASNRSASKFRHTSSSTKMHEFAPSHIKMHQFGISVQSPNLLLLESQMVLIINI